MCCHVPFAHHLQVIIPLLRVLEQLHVRGIIHRDIKPENIFFEADGSLVLGDFGLAIDSSADKPCSRVGTHDYMAPEVRLLDGLLLAFLCW
jgi:serine/threonine protein kinase